MEDSAWSRTVKLRTKDVNLFRRLRTSRLLEMLQEASIAHTEELGWTRETTLDRGFLWVVAMQQLQVIRMPEYDETVTLRSWPGPMMHVLYPRQYLLEDEEGNALVRGSAIWTLVDTETRAMADPDAHGVVIEGARTSLDYPLPGLVLLASGFAAVFVWFKRDDSAKKKMERRRKAFELQIPDMSLQMILLLNAGLVVESAFAELLSRGSADDGPLYTIFRDLKALSRAKNTSFVTELYCYARKAASADLMRFATLVYEHAGRGSSLADKLEREREMQSSGRMSAARAKVRQAETRLCFPLILLLIALIIITALPSFMSM